MKTNLLFNIIVITFFLGACSSSEKKDDQPLHPIDTAAIDEGKLALNEKTNNNLTQTSGDLVFNIYVGDFVADKVDEKKAPMYLNRITVSLDSIKNDILFGYSVVAGNKRPFKGNVSKKEEGYVAEVKEPGDNKYDGVFTFTLSLKDHVLRGEWTANNPKLAVSKRVYSLKQKIFEYNPKQQGLDIESSIAVYNPSTGEQFEGEVITSDAAKINASMHVLKESDVENMYKRDLEVMRNAIYARHGYSFKNREMRYFFDSQVDWYIPYSTNVTKDLTNVEQDNIALIKRYEDHATSYYDSFGR